MFSLLGGTIKKTFTKICDQKLFLVYDIPHSIKSLRNNLLNVNIQFGNKIISFDDVKKTYEIDSNSSTARAMCKMTIAHLAPNTFQKMSCKLVVQVLSRSIATAIKTCVSTKELNSSTVLNTASFIEDVNDMFDSANSKNLYDPNPNRRPLNDNNPQVFENLKKNLYNFSFFFSPNSKKKQPKNKQRTLCFRLIFDRFQKYLLEKHPKIIDENVKLLFLLIVQLKINWNKKN
jgi:hypothetical protein